VSLKQALFRARDVLAQENIEDSPLEGELLLRHTLGIGRTQLYLELDRKLSPGEEATFQKLLKRRLGGEPSAYITGHREFYGLDFYVDPRVLIPRPESELLVEEALRLARGHQLSTIAEVGTGSGAIAVSLALELPQTSIYATDISAPALEVARINCRKHGVIDRVCLLHGDMLDPLPEAVELIIANLPYVRESELSEISFEPLLALDGGGDGTEKIRRLCRQLAGKLRPGGFLLLEIGQGQAKAVTTLLDELFPAGKIRLLPDLSGIERVVSLSLT
jgi:release factor glutamine methyltransferase